jgi:peroxiredoxin
LSFEILTDPRNNIAKNYGIAFEMPEYLKSFYREKGIDLLAWNGDDSWTLPVPANFIVGSDRVILYASGDPDYTTRPDPNELLETLVGL